MKKALIITDPFNPNLSLEVKQMFYKQGVDVHQICLNDLTNSEYFIKSYLLTINKQTLFNFKEIAKLMSSIIQKENYNYVCCSSTQYVKNLISRISVITNSGLVADVIDFQIQQDDIDLNRPIYSNKMLATICCKSAISMFSVIRGIYSNDKSKQVGEVIKLDYQIDSLQYEIKEKENKYNLEKSNYVVAVGMGAKNSLKDLYEIEHLVDIKIGATKKLVDNNLIKYDHQIGISGKIISPKIYIAIGVEGFIHHVLGMNQSELIVSVNNNQKAAINKMADIVILSDADKFNKKLLIKIKDELNK